MIVSQLVEELQKLPQNLEVYVSSDGEGNNHRLLADVGIYPVMFYKRGMTVLADEDVDDYISQGDEVVDVCIIYPC